MEKTALVIGATGGIGGETAVALLARGWKVKALNRRPEEAARKSIDPRIEWVAGDAMDPASVLAAARDASVIIHAVNPPGYRNWKGQVLPMLDSTIAAGRAVGARVVLPGTVYNYGPEVLPRVRETAEQSPRTRKGAIRVEMERRLKDSEVPALVVRACDFFGPRAGNNWFSQGIVTPGRPVRWLTYPGRAGVGHGWAYLPDVARTIALLLDRAPELQPFAVSLVAALPAWPYLRSHDRLCMAKGSAHRQNPRHDIADRCVLPIPPIDGRRRTGRRRCPNAIGDARGTVILQGALEIELLRHA